MHGNEELQISYQIRKRVEDLAPRLSDIQRELDEISEFRQKNWPELEPGSAIVQPSPDRGTASELYLRQGKTYTKFHYAHLEAAQCFESAAAISSDFAGLREEFNRHTWRTGNEGLPPRVVADQCTKTRLYLDGLLKMLDDRAVTTRSIDDLRRCWKKEKWPERLRNAKTKRGHTHKDAAEWCGVAPETYRGWERRNPKVLAAQNLPAILKYIQPA